VLAHIGDLERLMARICTNRANPRDVAALRSGLARLAELRTLLGKVTAAPLCEVAAGLDPLAPLAGSIAAALVDDPPQALASGGVVKKGYNAELDELRSAALDGKSWIARLQKTESQRTGISSLKVT
jgi:DNA mismatch repair protein MutS